MTRLIGFAGVLLAACTAGSGVLLAYTRAAALAGWFMALAGGGGLLGLWLIDATSSVDAGQYVLVVAGFVLLPASLWAYPHPRWRHAVDVLLAAALIGPGLVGCFYVRDPDVLIVMGIVGFLALVAQMWWRLERSSGQERRALAWVALTTAVTALISLTLQFVASNEGIIAASVAILAAIPLSMVVGVLRPDTVDVRGLAVAASVTATLAIGYLAYFASAVAVLQIVGITDPSPVALAVVGLLGAVALHPAASALRGVMDEILFGGRPDPLDAASRVADTIGRDPDEALTAVREALNLPYVALRRGDDILAHSGEPVAHTRRIATDHNDATTPVLEVGMRPGDLRLSPREAHVLHLITPVMVQLVRATELSTQLQQSRAKALTGIADERRRLRNELHDGLGPALTGIGFATDAARNLVVPDPTAAHELLGTVREDISSAIEQVRHLVYGMRPPALDELGLVQALQQRTRALGPGLQVHYAVSGELGKLPAAVEVAAYRIVLEALTNTARHSPAHHATVSLTRTGNLLTVEVTDTGQGKQPWNHGVGLASMQERVAELGGTLTAGPGPRGGEVRALLPLSV